MNVEFSSTFIVSFLICFLNDKNKKKKNRIFFAALLIDEIFADIDDVFPFPLQAGPLDMGTPQFSARRKRLLDRRLRQIKAFDDKQMSEAVRQGWQRIYCNIDYFLHSFKIN